MGFDSFGHIYDDNGLIHGGQRAKGVFCKVLVTGCIQNVDVAILILEGHHGGRHGNPPLLFNFHEVGGCRLLDFIVLDGPGFLDGSPKKEQLFRERRFPCVRVGDNPKGSSAGYFVLNLHGVLFSHANVGFVYVNLMAKPVLT